jgi:hypothetical protein
MQNTPNTRVARPQPSAVIVFFCGSTKFVRAGQIGRVLLTRDKSAV